MDCWAACAALLISLKKTEVTFQVAAVTVYLDITKLWVHESENATHKEGTQSWCQYATISIQVTWVQDEDQTSASNENGYSQRFQFLCSQQPYETDRAGL